MSENQVEMDTKGATKAGKRAKASTSPKKATKMNAPPAGDVSNRSSMESVRFENEEAERAAALKLFQEFDKDKSGAIDSKELQALARKVGRPLTKKELHDALLILDKDKSGTIEFEEFFNWFANNLTQTATPRHMVLAEVRRKMRRYTPSNVVMDALGPAFGVVVPTDWSWGRMVDESQHVWARWTAGTIFESSKKKRVRAIFNKYDTDGSGDIDLDEFAVFVSEMGEKMTPAQLEVALAEIDDDGNGTIDFEEFYKWWCSDPAHEKDADFANRMKNTVLGYRDTSTIEKAAEKESSAHALAGGSGDPGLIAENRRLKAQLAAMQAQLDAVSGNKGDVDLERSPSFEAIVPRGGDDEDASSSDEDDGPAPSDQPRKKKGKRKSRKPQKLEDSDEYETSEDDTGKIRRKSAPKPKP